MDIGGEWIGRYGYALAEERVPFDARLVLDGTQLSGRMSEPNTFIDAPVGELLSIVDGTAIAGSVTFVKRYRGFEGLRDPIYSGRMSADGRRIQGTWHFTEDPDWRGGFLMIRSPRIVAQAVRRATVKLDR